MLRGQVFRACDDVGVHPTASGRTVADPHWGATCPREPRTARATVQVDGDIETLTVERSSEGHVVADALESRISGQHDDLVQIRVASDDGGGRRFSDIWALRLGAPATQIQYQ